MAVSGLSFTQESETIHSGSQIYKEETMNRKSIVMIGFLSISAATGAMNASSTIASDVDQVAGVSRVGHGGSIYQVESERTSDGRVQITMSERIGAGGSIYSSSRPVPFQAGECHVAGGRWKQVSLIERIGAGGSTYSSSISSSTKS